VSAMEALARVLPSFLASPLVPHCIASSVVVQERCCVRVSAAIDVDDRYSVCHSGHVVKTARPTNTPAQCLGVVIQLCLAA